MSPIKIAKFLSVAVAASLTFLGSVSAASFDCTKAATPLEKTICGSTRLSEIDEKLAEAYKSAKTASQDPAKLKSEQIEWIKEARKCQSDANCIERVYGARISELNPQPAKFIQEPVAASPVQMPSSVELQANVSQPAASAIEAVPAVAVASAETTLPTPVASEATAASVDSKPSIFSDAAYQKYALIAGGVVLSLLAAYFIIKLLILLTKKTADKASSAARAGVSKITEEGGKIKENFKLKDKNISDQALHKISAISDLATANAKAVMQSYGGKIKENKELNIESSNYEELIDNNGEVSKNIKDETKQKLKNLSDTLLLYANNQCFELISPLNRAVALDYSTKMLNSDAALHLDDAVNFSESIPLICGEIERLITIDNDIINLGTRISDGLKVYQSNIPKKFIDNNEYICDLTRTKEEKLIYITGIIRATLLEALGLSDTDYNWNISQAAISYKSLDNNFMEITFNIQKMESNLWVELTKIWAPVEFSASDSCRVLNSIDVDVYNKLEAMMLSITIQKLSSDNKTSFYLNKNLRIAMWVGVTMCAGFAFWNISSDYYRMSGFSIGATMLYAAMFFGPVYWFFNKKILKRKCPNCLALFSTDTPSQELLGSQEITLGTIDVEAGKVHSKSGQHIATLTEKRENKTTISTYRYYHCCDRCNFVWNTVDSSMALIGHVGSRI